jgi:hypothetical protein
MNTQTPRNKKFEKQVTRDIRAWERMNEAQRVVNEASSESMKHLDYRGRK